MNFLEKVRDTPQKELMAVLGISRPIISEIQNQKREITEFQTKTLEAYFASLECQEDLRINIPEKNIEKFREVLLYILSKVGSKPNVGLTVLYKLLYFIDFDYYEKYEEQLMGLTYMKNHYGPTPREFSSVVSDMVSEEVIDRVTAKHFSHQQKKLLPVVEADLSKLSAQEIQMVDFVLQRYSDYTATQLSDLSHEDTPWQMAEDGKDIDYEYAFYRPERFSVREYSSL